MKTSNKRIQLFIVSATACLLVPALSACDSKGGVEEDPFVFASTSFAAYTQVDSHAMPEVGTALIEAANGLSGTALRDTYNAATPTGRGSTYNAEIQNSLTLFHTALDDDLTGLGLDPATP